MQEMEKYVTKLLPWVKTIDCSDMQSCNYIQMILCGITITKCGKSIIHKLFLRKIIFQNHLGGLVSMRGGL